MTSDVPVRCKCGRVRGLARHVSPRTVNRVICYCHDCRAFLHQLERDDLVNSHGGTEIIQVARSRLEISAGNDQLRCVRLSDEGLHRWYAQCCRTPIANTMPKVPFAGVARVALVPSAPDEELLGPSFAANVGGAVGGRPPGAGFFLRGLAHTTRLFASWVVRGLGHPTPFFDRQNRPTVTPEVLTPAALQKLREHPRA